MHDNSNETQNGKLKQQETKAKPRVAKTKWKTSATEKHNRKQQKQQVMLEQTEHKNIYLCEQQINNTTKKTKKKNIRYQVAVKEKEKERRKYLWGDRGL